MLHTGVEDWVRTKIRSSYIIAEDDWRMRERDPKFSEERANPLHLCSSICNGSIFSLCRRSSNTGLFLRRPRYWCCTKEEDESISGDVIICISRPVRIGVRMERQWRVAAKHDTMGKSASKISEYTFRGLLVLIGGLMHELGETVDTVGDIRSRNREILEAPY